MSDALIADRDLSLRRMREDDLARILVWRRAPHVRAFWDNDEEPELTEASLKEHYRPLLDASHATTAAIFEASGIPIGYLQLYDWASYPEGAQATGIPTGEGTFGLDVFLGEAAYLGRGLGARAVALACRHLFEARGASRVALLTAIENVAAQRAYERAGFVRVREALDTDTRGGARIASWLMVRER